MAVTILQKAERLPNGRVKGVAPAQLWPRVLRHLTQAQMAEFSALEFQAVEIWKKKQGFIERLGLNPKGTYRISPKGEVIEVGKHRPIY